MAFHFCICRQPSSTVLSQIPRWNCLSAARLLSLHFVPAHGFFSLLAYIPNKLIGTPFVHCKKFAGTVYHGCPSISYQLETVVPRCFSSLFCASTFSDSLYPPPLDAHHTTAPGPSNMTNDTPVMSRDPPAPTRTLSSKSLLSSPPRSYPPSPGPPPAKETVPSSTTGLTTTVSGPAQAAGTSSSSNGTALASPGVAQLPPPARRSSFGLNFLSNLTNTIRPNGSASLHAPANPASHTPASAPDSPHHFMSNSPTIANLNGYAVAPHSADDNIDPIHEVTVINNAEEPVNNSSSDTDQPAEAARPEEVEPTDTEIAPVDAGGPDKDGTFLIRLTPLIDHSSTASGLYFSPVIRKMRPSTSISIGRYTEKNKSAAHAPQGSSAPIVFKSKVVSRTHALFQCNSDGQWFLKDCKSSSGTFLNHIRLSPASQELTLMPLIDGDIIQLGMDYRGGTEEVYRCVKMRCEFNKSWQRKVNQFNLAIHKKLQNLAISPEQPSTDPIENALTNATKDELSECAICLLKLEPCQALFISPCSHSWHYKCIRPIIIKSYPQFYCPNCRSMCDLETDIEDDE